MPIILEPMLNIKGNYTAEEKEMLNILISSFRVMVGDADKDKNILNMKNLTYTDDRIIQFLQQACDDVNVYTPMTRFSIFNIYQKSAIMLLVKGAVVFSLMAEGLLQLKNQVDYNDAGLSVSLFNKTGQYQSWYGTILQDYMMTKQQFKQSIIPSSYNAGFFGVSSQFGYMYSGSGEDVVSNTDF